MGIIEIKKNESGRSKWRKPCPRCGAEGIARSDPNYPQYEGVSQKRVILHAKVF